MSNSCGLCGRTLLEEVYTPERSARGIKVHLCRFCGLVQSLPRIDHVPRRGPAVSSGADWGNIRYGKGFRTKAAIEAIGRHCDVNAPLAVLDVGSNRGSFVHAFLAAAPESSIVAVEPDERVAHSCAGSSRIELIQSRIESTALETGRFDIVHSCHTIEHLAAPASVLADHWRTLKENGILIVDAPNIAFLGSDDVVEEWFIDKHLFHFSAGTLARMIEMAGFEIIERPDPADIDNILIVARKSDHSTPKHDQDREEVVRAEDLIATYIANRARNIMALTAVATEIAAMKPRGVAVWGAGRIFDSLVVHGKLDARCLSLLIDKHLKPLVPERHGCVVQPPEALRNADAGVVIVMSRSFAPEIADEARRLAPSAQIVLYSDLLAQARSKMAA